MADDELFIDHFFLIKRPAVAQFVEEEDEEEEKKKRSNERAADARRSSFITVGRGALRGASRNLNTPLLARRDDQR